MIETTEHKLVLTAGLIGKSYSPVLIFAENVTIASENVKSYLYMNEVLIRVNSAMHKDTYTHKPHRMFGFKDASKECIKLALSSAYISVYRGFAES